MDAAERVLLESTVRDALTGAGDGGAAAVDRVLRELGWLEMLAAEPRDAVAIVFGTLGSSGCSASLLDDVVVAALGLSPRPDLAVLLPPFAGWHPPGRIDGGRVLADGLATARIASASEVLLVCAPGPTYVVVAVPSIGLDVTPVHGLDPDAGLHRVHVEAIGSPSDPPLDSGAWDAAVAAARRAIAHQIAGASRAMLSLARDHAVERVQFGRPIARFQAVRHRLAEALVAVEALEAALGAAWDAPGPVTAALAKAAAGRTARTVGGHAQQVLAGVGFTTEHPFHRFLKRTMVLDGLFGSSDEITVDLGRRLLADRTVPTLVEL